MRICIPTYKRTNNQITLELIPKELIKNTTLVCNKFEEEELKQYGVNILSVPDEIKGIGKVRQFVIENIKEKYVWFIDDDLNFLRREPNSIKLKKIKDSDFIDLYNWNKEQLEKGFGIVGCSAQGGNNRFEGKFTYFSRIFSVYALNTKILNKHNIKFSEMEVMEDFNVVLDLLRFGYKSIINTEFAHNQKASNQSGGCSESGRTLEVQKKSALYLAQKHKPFVKVVKKKSKNWIGMEERYDVRIYWKKAFTNGNYIKGQNG